MNYLETKDYDTIRSEGEDPVFILSAHLMSPAAELEYLRKLSELYILFLLPRCYSLSPMKYLLREILACKSKFNLQAISLVKLCRDPWQIV